MPINRIQTVRFESDNGMVFIYLGLEHAKIHVCVCVHLTYIITNFEILSKLRDLGKCRLLILIENKKLCFFNILKYFQVLACDDPG